MKKITNRCAIVDEITGLRLDENQAKLRKATGDKKYVTPGEKTETKNKTRALTQAANWGTWVWCPVALPVTICILFAFVYVYFDILNSCFVGQRSGGFPVFCLIWVSSVCLHVIWAWAQPESTSSLFGYFRVSGSFIITGFTPRFLRSVPLLPYLHISPSLCKP